MPRRSARTSGSAFSCTSSEAEVCRHQIVSSPVAIALRRDPAADRFGDLDQALAVGGHRQPMQCLPHAADLCPTG